jgi:hypothetical protein
MGMPVDIQVATAVVNQINLAPPGTYCAGFALTREYLCLLDLGTYTGIKVTVSPPQVASEWPDRVRVLDVVTIDVAVRTKVRAAPADLAAYVAEIDGYRQLTDQIRRWLQVQANRRLASMQAAVLVDPPHNAPTYVVEHLAQLGQYTSVIKLAYRVATNAGQLS